MLKSKKCPAKADNSYKPIEFKILGIQLTEKSPRTSLNSLDFVRAERIAIKNSMNLPINYFDVRFTLTPEGKKRADMAFLTHVIRERDRDGENVTRGEIIRYYLIKLRYLPELLYVNKTIGTKKTDNYMSRWGYLLDHDPSFDDLIHGTSVEEALYTVENVI